MSRSLAVPLVLDRAAATPLSSQVAGQIRDALVGGALPVGSRLPSTRALAADLAVSRSVTVQAFDQLAAEGWLESRQGSGTYVAAGTIGGCRTSAPIARKPFSMGANGEWFSSSRRSHW